MKKIIILSTLLAVFLNSCVVEWYDKPKRSQIQYQQTLHLIQSLRAKVAYVRATDGLEQWMACETVEEKYLIEDIYFADNKIRIYDDTIKITGIGSFKTFGKPLSQQEWEVLINDTCELPTFKISKTQKGEFKMIYNDIHTEERCSLNIEKLDEYYFITGNGENVPMDNIDVTKRISYLIEDTLRYDFKEENPGYYTESAGFDEGRILVGDIVSDPSVNEGFRVKILSLTNLEINYNGYQDEYYVRPYYFYY